MLHLRIAAGAWLLAGLLVAAGAVAFWLVHHLAAAHAGAILI